MNLSYFGGFLVNPSPTYVTLVTMRFHDFSTMGMIPRHVVTVMMGEC